MKRSWKYVAFLSAAAVFGGSSIAASAAEVEVKMLNRGTSGVMVFEPAMVNIQPGDTVWFVPVDKGHNVQSLEGMWPSDVATFEGARDEEVVVTFNAQGLYGFECKPHAAMGMVGGVVVGDAGDVSGSLETTKLKGKGKKVMEGLLAELP